MFDTNINLHSIEDTELTLHAVTVCLYNFYKTELCIHRYWLFFLGWGLSQLITWHLYLCKRSTTWSHCKHKLQPYNHSSQSITWYHNAWFARAIKQVAATQLACSYNIYMWNRTYKLVLDIKNIPWPHGVQPPGSKLFLLPAGSLEETRRMVCFLQGLVLCDRCISFDWLGNDWLCRIKACLIAFPLILNSSGESPLFR